MVEKTLSEHIPDQNSRFNDMCREAVEEAIREVLGASVAEAYMKFIHNSLGISDEGIFTGLDVIFSSLNRIVEPGGRILSMRIVRKLYTKTGIPFEETPGRPLDDYIKSLKKEFDNAP